MKAVASTLKYSSPTSWMSNGLNHRCGNAQASSVVILRWILDSQLEGVDVSSELFQEGNNIPNPTGQVNCLN
jgi:hypothetical protein